MKNFSQTLDIVVRCGRIILENGGETHRVEDVMQKVGLLLGMVHCDSYVTLTGIMISAKTSDGEQLTTIKRITSRGINLNKIVLLNRLINKISCAKNISLVHFESELERIENLKAYPKRILIIFSGAVTGFFTLLFLGNAGDFAISFLIGMVLKTSLAYLGMLKLNDFFINLFGGALAAILALTASAIWPSLHYDTIIIGSIMLLVPGLAITNAIRDSMAGDLVSGIVRGIEAFITAIAIAVGTAVVFKFWFIFNHINFIK